MPEEIPITRVTESILGGMPIWEVWSLRPDGGNHVHGFPKSTLEQRVAEYDLDPEDPDTVLDVILYERFMSDEPSPSSVEADMPPALTLFEASSPSEAREAHLARVARIKERFQYVPHVMEERAVGFALMRATERSEDPLEAIRQDHGITPEGVAQRREAVHRMRFEVRSKQKPTGQPPGVDQASARRVQAMVEDPENPEITVAPGWVTLALRQD